MSRSNLDCGSTVATSTAVVYDWALTFGQEVELVWVSRVPSPSPSKEEEDDTIFEADATLVPHDGSVSHYALCWDIIYHCFHYVGSSTNLVDGCSGILYSALNWINVITAVVLNVIMIARLYAMYQGSRKMLIFLIVSFLAINIACIVMTAIGLKYIGSEEYVLSGAYMCAYTEAGDAALLSRMVWTLTLIWEVLALCLAVWIAVKHICGLQQLGQSTGLTIGDVFTVLMKSHVLYFASFTVVAALQLGGFSPLIESGSVGAEIYAAFLQVFSVLQMFVLGPRLILSVREFHAKLVADSDAATGMTSIVFEERVHVSTSNGV
ncbi:uncharacterized protein EDB91DRAFT_1251240 [Suillus paluster]|uniref:uncharacterized protein n=1 Tax=Suillus paluster TaxID=48578 RepID=UPI001B85D147|nr:uncharacterized protein EDB91DRAFT_1251240 [Suillus paluster]KAG1733574.1 hypothetical protein EDB91DRAFT_1251240 [Suillus paluster]